MVCCSMNGSVIACVGSSTVMELTILTSSSEVKCLGSRSDRVPGSSSKNHLHHIACRSASLSAVLGKSCLGPLKKTVVSWMYAGRCTCLSSSVSLGFSRASRRFPTSARLSCQTLTSSEAHRPPIRLISIARPHQQPSLCAPVPDDNSVCGVRSQINRQELGMCGLRCTCEAR